MTLDELLTTTRATVSVEEAGELLGVSRGTAYQAHRDGELPGALTLGRRRLVSVPALRRALGCEPPRQDEAPAGTGAVVELSSLGGDERGGDPPHAA